MRTRRALWVRGAQLVTLYPPHRSEWLSLARTKKYSRSHSEDRINSIDCSELAWPLNTDLVFTMVSCAARGKLDEELTRQRVIQNNSTRLVDPLGTGLSIHDLCRHESIVASGRLVLQSNISACFIYEPRVAALRCEVCIVNASAARTYETESAEGTMLCCAQCLHMLHYSVTGQTCTNGTSARRRIPPGVSALLHSGPFSLAVSDPASQETPTRVFDSYNIPTGVSCEQASANRPPTGDTKPGQGLHRPG